MMKGISIDHPAAHHVFFYQLQDAVAFIFIFQDILCVVFVDFYWRTKNESNTETTTQFLYCTLSSDMITKYKKETDGLI